MCVYIYIYKSKYRCMCVCIYIYMQQRSLRSSFPKPAKHGASPPPREVGVALAVYSLWIQDSSATSVYLACGEGMEVEIPAKRGCADAGVHCRLGYGRLAASTSTVSHLFFKNQTC